MWRPRQFAGAFDFFLSRRSKSRKLGDTPGVLYGSERKGVAEKGICKLLKKRDGGIVTGDPWSVTREMRLEAVNS
jgi:hypothetical protein